MSHQHVFYKAKIKITLAVASTFLIFLFGFLGCKKDLVQEPEIQSNAAVHDRSGTNPTVINGMLHFNSFADLEEFTKSLQDKEADTTQVRSAYLTLGIDVNAETIPNLTDYPVCLLTEQAIGGYTSARKSEETVINAALNNGDDNINSVVIFPYWKTALNADKAVHIGNRIYKYYDNGGVAVILNNDWTLFETVKTLPFESLRASFNLMITGDVEARSNTFVTSNLNATPAIQSSEKAYFPRFVAQLTSDGKYIITNASQIETNNGSNTFKWIYEDNTISFGPNPTKAISPEKAITLIINNGYGTQTTLNGAESILACSTDNFTITYLSNNQIRFELPGYVPGSPSNQYNLRWVFSDGTTFTSNPLVRTLISNGTVTCQFLYPSNGQVACQFTKPYFAKCGDKKSVPASKVFNYCGQRWKLDGTIWVQTGQVGSKVKYLKWYGAILGWKPANNQGACADLSGTYIREVYNPNKNCIVVNASGSHCLGNGTYPTTVSHTISEVPNVFSNPGQLSAGLGIKVCGVWHGWGYGGAARLVLP